MRQSFLKYAIPIVLTILVGAMGICVSDKTMWQGFVIASIGGTVVMLWAWQQNRWTTREVLILALLFRLMLLPVLPNLSDDAFRYIWDGWLQWNGINPFKYPPNHEALKAFHHLDIYQHLNSASYYAVYPPFSQLIFAFGAFFYPIGGWKVSYYLIKIVFVIFEFVGVWLMSKMVTPRSLILYAWSPLVLMEVAGQPHNEAILAFLLISCIWAMQNGHAKFAVVAITCAFWTKLYPILFIPFVLNRVGWRYIWVAILVGLGLLAPYYHPHIFANIKTSLDLYSTQFEFGAALYYGLKAWGTQLVGHEESKVLGPLLQNIFLFFAAFLFISDVRKRSVFAETIMILIGMFLLLATTVHPWYFVGLMAMIPFVADETFRDRFVPAEIRMDGRNIPAWHWYWAGALLTGTYLFYQGGDQMVWVKWAWIGWLVILVLGVGIGSLQEIQFRRGGTKFRWMESAIPSSETPLEVLDLGAGEGFVGFWMEKKLNARVTLADVINLNQTNLPHYIYDGKKLPFADQSFDVTVLSFVLHHCEDQDSVIQEAMRVTRKRILILESVYISKWDLKQLTFLDRLANRLRSGGLMKTQEEHLYFRTVKDWTIFFKSKGLRIALIREKGLFAHQQALFALDVSMPRV